MKATIIIISFLLIISCDQVTDTQAPTLEGEWLVPVEQVFDGGPGKDGIPALLNPELSSVSDISFMKDDDFIIAVKMGEEVRGYPHPILDWHEIINDEIGSEKFAVTYCPLTGSAIGWGRKLNGKESTFGVSGLLYNSNLIPYDRLTGSHWSQMLDKCINGELIGKEPAKFQVIEMSWKSFKNVFPDAQVVNSNTGHSRSYGVYPYGNYKTDQFSLLFPIQPTDNRLPWKERVLGVVNGSFSKAYKLNENFDGNNVFIDTLAGEEIIVVRNSAAKFGVVFKNYLGSKKIDFIQAVQDSLPVVMRDSLGNRYNFFGEVVNGPQEGEKLEWMNSYIAYWIAWVGFHPATLIYNE